MSPRLPRGFTLIEVLIALLVVALGVGALLATLTSSADTVARLREKSLAEWVALNRISEVRLGNTRPVVGVTSGSLEKFADGRWSWRQSVTDPGIAGILRVEVQVTHRAAAASEADDSFPALATAYGFLGTAVAPATGVDPDWSITAAGGGPGTGAPGTGGSNGGAGNPGGGSGAPQR